MPTICLFGKKQQGEREITSTGAGLKATDFCGVGERERGERREESVSCNKEEGDGEQQRQKQQILHPRQ